MVEINKQDYIDEVKAMFNHICLLHDVNVCVDKTNFYPINLDSVKVL